MEEKLQKLTKQQMLDLLNHLYVYGNAVVSFSPEDAFDRGYIAAYLNVKNNIVEIFNEYLKNE